MCKLALSLDWVVFAEPGNKKEILTTLTTVSSVHNQGTYSFIDSGGPHLLSEPNQTSLTTSQGNRLVSAQHLKYQYIEA